MTVASIIVDKRGPADWVILNRPERLNAITSAMASELADYFRGLENDERVRVVVLRGLGKAFCAGLDIKARLADERTGEDGIDRLPEIILAMRSCPQPIIAAVHGAACGGGFAFALASDVRIAAENARMNDAFVKLGISGCELGLSYFLPRQIGLSLSSELMYTGRFLDSARALRAGLVSEVVPEEKLDETVQRLVDDMLAIAPMALRKTKETLSRCLGVDDLATVLELEQHTQTQCMRGPDFEEGLKAFADKRAPRWSS